MGTANAEDVVKLSQRQIKRVDRRCANSPVRVTTDRSLS